jgi:hypothetical protein
VPITLISLLRLPVTPRRAPGAWLRGMGAVHDVEVGLDRAWLSRSCAIDLVCAEPTQEVVRQLPPRFPVTGRASQERHPALVESPVFHSGIWPKPGLVVTPSRDEPPASLRLEHSQPDEVCPP